MNGDHPPRDRDDKRTAVWMALSELFLGRELGQTDYHAIASVLAASGYALQELELILTEEVSPALRSNLGLLGVPEMLGWDPQTLCSIIEAQRTRRRSIWAQLIRRRQPQIVRERWREVRMILETYSH